MSSCLHYCLPGVPDLYNGRLLSLIQHAAARVQPSTSNASHTPSAAPSAEGLPGLMLARYNFAFYGQRFVQGVPPHLALQIQRHGPATPLACPLSAPGAPPTNDDAEGHSSVTSLLGVCSDLNPASSFEVSTEWYVAV
jgi:hypothetical protein